MNSWPIRRQPFLRITLALISAGFPLSAIVVGGRELLTWIRINHGALYYVGHGYLGNSAVRELIGISGVLPAGRALFNPDAQLRSLWLPPIVSPRNDGVSAICRTAPARTRTRSRLHPARSASRRVETRCEPAAPMGAASPGRQPRSVHIAGRENASPISRCEWQQTALRNRCSHPVRQARSISPPALMSRSSR